MKTLKKSRWVFVFKKPEGDFALLHSKNLVILFLDRESYEVFDLFKNPSSQSKAIADLKNDNKSSESREVIDVLIEEGFLVPEDNDELGELKKQSEIEHQRKIDNIGKENKLNAFRVVLTEKCNFRCKYCFVKNKKMDLNQDIPWPTLVQAYDLLISHNKGGDIEIQFFGGEPLLKFDLIKESVAYLADCVSKKKISGVQFGITTNASLVTGERARFLKENNFLVSVSLDGPEETNNANRVFSNQKGAYDTTIKGIKTLLRAGCEVGILVTPTVETVNNLASSCKYLISELGLKFITINTPQPVNGNWEIDGATFARELEKCYPIAKKHKAVINSFATRVIHSLNNQEAMIFSCSKFGQDYTATVTPNGMVSPCIVSWNHKDVLVPLEKFSLQGGFSKWKLTPPYFFDDCYSCPAMNVCGGPCPLEVYEMGTTPLPKNKKYQRCEFFKSFLEWAVWYQE